MTNITFIGAGNMARAIISGLIANNYDANTICVTNRSAEKLTYFKQQFGVQTAANNIDGTKKGDIVVLCVKPQQLQAVCDELRSSIQDNKALVISIAAGTTTTSLQTWLGDDTAIVRAMPNTPAMVQAATTGLFANANTSEAQRDVAESLFQAIGLAIWLADEALMPVVTALSGSGPAYFFLLMEAMQQAAQDLGLPEDTAKLLTLQTGLGATKLAVESSHDVAELRRSVTSPKGTTEQAINTLQTAEFEKIVAGAVQAAAARAKELS